MKFNLCDYRDNKFVMHCETKEQADCFCEFLHRSGRKWCTGDSYLRYTNWTHKNGGSCYAFNSGTHSTYVFFIRESYYEILEFEDFEWDGFDFSMQVDKTYIDDFLSNFVVN